MDVPLGRYVCMYVYLMYVMYVVIAIIIVIVVVIVVVTAAWAQAKRHSNVSSLSHFVLRCQLVIAFCITMSHRPTPCQLRLLLLATDVAVSDMMRMQQGAQFVVSRLTYVPFVT